MATGIMIMGPSGAGKTTLGALVAKELGYIFVDIDEYIWRKDTKIPFSEMYTKAEKISRLMEAISNCEHFVMAGSMDSFHEHFDPYFELVVHLHTDAQIRVKRVHERELEWFGERILEGGDMYEEHHKMLSNIAGYDYGIGGCTLQQHENWTKALKCKVIQLDGADALEKNLKTIVEIYKNDVLAEEYKLIRPSEVHKEEYESMMDEWESFGGRLNPGALRRFSNKQQKNVSFEEWLKWMEDDRKAGQDLYFFLKGNRIIGAISIRFKRTLENVGTDGHSGYGIRPSERRKGYASIMLSMALPIMKKYGIDPVVITCAKENIGSAKTIIKNGGKLMEEVIEPDTGETVQIYRIDMCE